VGELEVEHDQDPVDGLEASGARVEAPAPQGALGGLVEQMQAGELGPALGL
jgi:hypothetical protein